ncbi:MAG TPA: hypothetical protein VM166_06470 [Gemmatimonadaceae bacterium]|nr:hypothetical protein [Gemmatimonadaceae bacterium]
MKGCFRAVIVLIIVCLLAGLWYFYARVEKTPTTSTSRTPAGAPAVSEWQPLSESAGAEGQAAVQSLSRQAGPVFANLTGAQAASYIFVVLAKQLPPSARNAEAAIIGDRLYVRSEVDLSDFGGSTALGPIGMVLGDRDSVRLGGSINMLRPGLAEFLVQEVKLGKLDVPSALIPRLLTRIKRGKPVEGISQNGLPMVMPAYISDVRIANGRITLYKSVK